MGLLVEDLLLLARLDQQRPLTFAPVDLAGDRRRRRPRREGRPARPADRPAPGRVADRRPRRPRGRGPAAPGRRQPGHQRARPTPRPATRVTVTVAEAPDDPDVARAAGRRRGPGHGPGRRRAGVRALLPGRRLPHPRAPAAPAWGWRSCPRSSPRTAARSDLDTAPGKGAVVTVRLPRSGPADVPPPPGRTGATEAGLARPVTIRDVTTNESRTIPDAEPLAAASRPRGRAARADRGLGDHDGRRRPRCARPPTLVRAGHRAARRRPPSGRRSCPALDDLADRPPGLQPGQRGRQRRSRRRCVVRREDGRRRRRGHPRASPTRARRASCTAG